jgi:hypothetical protein
MARREGDGSPMKYLVLEYDLGPSGREGMQALINAKAAEGYELLQVVRCSTYEWVLFFKRTDGQASA